METKCVIEISIFNDLMAFYYIILYKVTF